MQTYMVIPTYWTGENNEWNEGDAVFDHPTPLDKEGTLLRTLKSIDILEDKDFTLIIVAATTNPKYDDRVEKKLKEMLQKVDLPIETILFTPNRLKEFKEYFLKDSPLSEIVSLTNYSNIRNVCLLLPYILDAEIAVFIDDDEVFEDPKFMNKAKEFIGRRFYGNTVDGIAGYYLNEDNEYYDKVNIEPWMTYWDRFGGKREAFDKIIGNEPRLKKTPFAFGGAMVFHRNLFRIVPFDPKITRGEDTDYVINAKMFGFNFYLDNKLAIKHLPPPKKHPIWKRFREDIYRFLYDKSKIDTQYEKINLHYVTPEDFDPYPGQFLKDDLEDKIFKTNLILALHYLTVNDIEATKETIKNIHLAKYKAKPHYNTFDEYLQFQKKWRALLERTKEFAPHLKQFINNNFILKKGNKNISHYLSQTKINNNYNFDKVPLFKPFTKEEIKKIFSISEIVNLNKDDYVFKADEINRCIYVVLSGQLSVIKESPQLKETVVVANLKEGDHFNETSIFFDKPHNVSIICKTPVTLLAIKREKLLKFIEKEHDRLGTKLLWIISQKLSERLVETTEKYSESKTFDSDISDFMKKSEE